MNEINDLQQQLQQLKQENEELQDSLGLANKYVNKYKATLNEIKEIAQKMPLTSYYKKQILQKIKQVKEGEE